MKNITKWTLAAAMAIGGLGLAAAPANAAQIGVYVGTGAEYVPPCPGPGYVWIAGYYSSGYWVPGRWAFNGVAVRDHVDFYHGRANFGRNHFDRDHRADHRDDARRDFRGHRR